MADNLSFDENVGTNRLANVLTDRIKRESERPLSFDFGTIEANGSLKTNTFPVSIPKGQYSVCRQLTLGGTGSILTLTTESGSDTPIGGEQEEAGSGNRSQEHREDLHKHSVIVPENMRSLQSGDSVLVAWVQNEAVVIDIISSSERGFIK